MSTLDKDKKVESEPLTLEDLELDVSEPSINFTATLHFEFSDIFNAIEHIETEPAEAEPEIEEEAQEFEPVEQEVSETAEPEEPTESVAADDVESEPSEQPETQPEDEPSEQDAEPEIPAELIEPEEPAESEPGIEEEPQESESEIIPDTPTPEELGPEAETEPASPEPASPEPEIPAAPALMPEETEQAPAKPESGLLSRLRGQDKGTKKLVLTDIILLAVIVISIVAGLAVANSMVDKAKAANEAKIAEMQANIKEVNLSESLYDMAADKVIDDVAVPTYTLDELYALDLREKTGFTAEDLKMITRKGLVGCEEAFVKAEETYGVNSIFLMSIASLESAYGTQMFRPNNMFGYGRTGFSSKEECIMTVAKGLGTRYLPPGGSLYGGSPTLKGVNKRYAANPQWYYKVGKYMQGYYAELAAAKNGALDKFE